MKTVSRIAIGIALAFGTTGVAGGFAAAAAQETEAYEPEYSKEARTSLAASQEAKEAGDNAAAAAAARQALAVAETPDDKFVGGQMLFSLGQQTGDVAMENEGLAAMARSGSPQLTASLREQIYMNLAQKAQDSGDTAAAQQYYQELLQADPNSANAAIGLGELKVASGDVSGGIADIRAAIAAKEAAGEEVPEAWYRRAFVLAYDNNLASEVPSLAMALLKAYPTQVNWRDALATYYAVNAPEDQLALDLFRLMHDADTLERRFYIEYANLADQRGLPGETVNVIDKGVAAGELEADNVTIKELRSISEPKIKSDRASLADLAAEAAGEANGKLAKGTADAYLSYGDNQDAARLYRMALEKGGVDEAEVNTRLGIALARSGDEAGARAAFQAVNGAPRQTLAEFWISYLDNDAAAAAAATPAPAPVPAPAPEG